MTALLSDSSILLPKGDYTPYSTVQFAGYIILTGNLGANPEMTYTPNGLSIARFNLAFSSGKDKTSWIGITCFDKMAEVSEKHLHKGARIAVSGKLEQDTWETESGEKRSTHKIIAHSIEFIRINEPTEATTPF